MGCVKVLLQLLQPRLQAMDCLREGPQMPETGEVNRSLALQ